MYITEGMIKAVYQARKERLIHPVGAFDNAKRWYPSKDENVGLNAIRSPSRTWPYSYLVACRTLRHVRLLAEQSPEFFVSEVARATAAISRQRAD